MHEPATDSASPVNRVTAVFVQKIGAPTAAFNAR